MKNKLWLWLIGTIFGLAFFSSIRIIAIYCYHMQVARGNQTLAMTLMDRVNAIDLSSLIAGWLYGWVVGIMILIVCNR